MSLLTRIFKPSFGRRLLENRDFLPSFKSRDTLTHDGNGKRLLPETSCISSLFPEPPKNWAEEHGKKFIRSCIMDIKFDPDRLSIGLYKGYFEEYSDGDQYRIRILLGIALIDAVRANNTLDDATIRTIFNCYWDFQEADKKYRIKSTVSRNVEEYASIVQILHNSDLYY